MGNKVGEWALHSGTWGQAGGEFSLLRSVLGNDVPEGLAHAEVVRLMCMPQDDASPPCNFPPEFRYSPSTGRALTASPSREQVTWVPPYGNPVAISARKVSARGLRQYSGQLQLSSPSSRRADGDPDIVLEPPPPGDYYEFFSGNFGGLAASLIALNVAQGNLFVWLPRQESWMALEHLDELLIDVCTLPKASWRAETAPIQGAPASTLFLPTDSGLACVVPDVMALGYRVRYVGDLPVAASPIAFDGKFWVPLRAAAGKVVVIAVDSSGEVVTRQEVDADVDAGEFGAPVAYGRQALWLSSKGRLRLLKQQDGKVSLTFTPWPVNVAPSFEFGSAYLSGDGGIWQLCFDSAEDRFVYVRVDVTADEIVPTTSPRQCSGSVNYRFAQRTNLPPWEEPSHGDDAGSNEFVIPLLEAAESGQVLGMRLLAPGAIANTLASIERIRAELILEDRSGSVVSHTLSAQEPWDIRLFVHDHTLWAYHARLRRLEGWRLEQ